MSIVTRNFSAFTADPWLTWMNQELSKHEAVY